LVEVDWKRGDKGQWVMEEKAGSSEIIDVDLVLLSMGFVHAVHEGLVHELGLELDQRGNLKIDKQYQTSAKKVFAAGDAASGASLVVTSINNGRQAAENVHEFLKTL
jgi:glutamate synthase (NADPH) small chain